MITCISNVSFEGKRMPKAGKSVKKGGLTIENKSEYIRGFRGIMDGFLTPEKLEKERMNATISGNFSFLQGVKDAVLKMVENAKKAGK